MCLRAWVCVQYTLQRQSKPDFGLCEEVLLPFYTELASQYCAVGFGAWAGNASLLTLYEQLAEAARERKHAIEYPANRYRNT